MLSSPAVYTFLVTWVIIVVQIKFLNDLWNGWHGAHFSLRFAFHYLFFQCTLMTRIIQSHNAEVFKLLLRNERQIIQLLEISELMKRKEALIHKEKDKIPRKQRYTCTWHKTVNFIAFWLKQILEIDVHDRLPKTIILEYFKHFCECLWQPAFIQNNKDNLFICCSKW